VSSIPPRGVLIAGADPRFPTGAAALTSEPHAYSRSEQIFAPSASFRTPKIDYVAKTMRKQRKQCGNIFSDFLNRFSQISGRRPPSPPLVQRANFSPLSLLSRLFAIQKSIKLRKQCKNSESNAKTSLNHSYFLRFSTQIFPDFWPQATPSIGRRPNTQPTGCRPPTPSPCEKNFCIE